MLRATFQKQVFEYILLTYPEADMDALRANLRAAGFDEMEGLVGTIAEALMERGEARGLKRGKAVGLEQGKAVGLTRLLERRFGPLPATARDRIAAAGPGELDAWLDRVLDADSLDAGVRQERPALISRGPAPDNGIRIDIWLPG